ncbi:unnamed protein product, partial [Discosporangium mesarthrocarpum]
SRRRRHSAATGHSTPAAAAIAASVAASSPPPLTPPVRRSPPSPYFPSYLPDPPSPPELDVPAAGLSVDEGARSAISTEAVSTAHDSSGKGVGRVRAGVDGLEPGFMRSGDGAGAGGGGLRRS